MTSLNSAAATMIMMMITLLVTTSHSINNTTGTRSTSSLCNGGSNDDPLCLVGSTDLDSDEFMMDSEISRRILAGNSVTSNTLDPYKASSCDRASTRACHADQKNRNPPGVDCAIATYNRQCHKYP